MATTEEIQFFLTRALGLLNNLTNAIEWNTKDIVNNVISQFAIIESNVVFSSETSWNAYVQARGNILIQAAYAHNDLLTGIKTVFESVFINVNQAWQETLVLVASLRAAAESVVTEYIADVAEAVGDKIWNSQQQIVAFIVEGLNYVNTRMAIGFDNFAEAIKSILGVIPEKVWSFLETWLDQDVPD